MNVAEINRIMSSSNKGDWQYSSSQPLMISMAYYGQNPLLRIEMPDDERGIHSDDFKEPWANKHPDPVARSYYAFLFYGPTLIRQYVLVSVDGGRALLPLPDRQSLIVEEERYLVASLFDTADTLDQYMSRSGLSLVT